jgi:hypothetical protein
MGLMMIDISKMTDLEILGEMILGARSDADVSIDIEMYENCKRCADILEKAAEALEKQIPRTTTIMEHCPECDYNLSPVIHRIGSPLFCPNCGQRLGA